MINHLWQSTLFAIAAGLLTVAFRKNRAQVRYWLWFSASFKFFVPFALLMSLGSQLELAPVAGPIATGAVSVTMTQIVEPFPDAPSAPSPADWTPAVIPIVWACGFLGVAAIRLRGWLRIQVAVRASTPIDIPAPVEVRSAPGLLEPGVVGFWPSILLLPDGIVDRLTPPQLEAVLAHELCHVRRRDNLFAAIHMIVEALFWFHPLVWWIGARLVEERERACDEGVLTLGSEPRVYAEAILNVCKLYVESPLACVSGVTGSDLRKRIETIMINRMVYRLSFTRKTALAITAIAALMLPIGIGIMNAPLIEAQSAPASTPRFDVASVKPCKGEPGRMQGADFSSPGRLSTGCELLVGENNLGLIQRAYVRNRGGHPNPFGILTIKGGPAWIHSEMFTINARAEGNPGRGMMQGPMLQALLEDRFKLQLHRETKESPVYALTLLKDSSKLKPFQEGSCVQMPMIFPMPELEPGKRYCKAMIMAGPTPAVNAEGSTLEEFTKLLNLIVDRPVIDRTGLAKRFNIRVEFARDQATPGLRDPDIPVPEQPGTTIFTAIQEQLGLKLVPSRGPVEFLVIDHVERPSAN